MALINAAQAALAERARRRQLREQVEDQELDAFLSALRSAKTGSTPPLNRGPNRPQSRGRRDQPDR
jgi:hypothetical protein